MDANAYLPGIFRRRHPVLGNDIPEKYQNLLTQEPKKPTLDDIYALGEQPDTPSGSINLALPETVDSSDLGPAPLMVRKDKMGRPVRTGMIGDGDVADQQIAYNQALQNYDPDTAPHAKGWHRWLPAMLKGAGIGFMTGGLGGAIGGAAYGGLANKFNKNLANEQWKARELGQSDQDVARIQTRQQQGLKTAKELADLENTAATTRYRKAQAEQLGKGKPEIKQNENGEWISVDPVSKTIAPILDPKTGQPAKGKPTGAKQEWIHDDNGVAHLYSDGKDTGRVDPGRNLVKVPGYGLMRPGEKMSADATAENRDWMRTKDVRTQQDARNEAIAKQGALATQARNLYKDALDYEQQVKDLDPNSETYKEDRQRLLNQAETSRSQARQKDAEANSVAIPPEAMMPSKVKPQVDHARFEKDYANAKTPQERQRIMKLYQDAVKAAQ